MLSRCPWVPENDPLYQKYHDTHWGIPCTDDSVLFEYLVLEAAQAGLSWKTVLVRRDSYRKAFLDYNITAVAAMTDDDIGILLQDQGIIRNKLKVSAAINNAKRFLEVQSEFGTFATYIWKFVDYKPIQSKLVLIKDYPVRTVISDAISKDLKRRGFSFIGTTIMYAYMQSIGMVNDHTVNCFCYEKVAELGKEQVQHAKT